jgi:hypothetical protein
MKTEQEDERKSYLDTGKVKTTSKRGRRRACICRKLKALNAGPRPPKPPRIRFVVGKESVLRAGTDIGDGDGSYSNNDRDKDRGKEDIRDKMREGAHQDLIKSRPGTFLLQDL